MKNKFDKINTSRLKTMLKNDALVEESLKVLMKNLVIDISKIKKHLQNKEYAKISELCHKMKVSIHFISLDNIENEVNQLGKKDNNLDEAKIIKYTQKVIQEIDKVLI